MTSGSPRAPGIMGLSVNSVHNASLLGGYEPAAVLASIVKAIDQVKKLASEIVVDRASFLRLASYLADLRYVLDEVTKRRPDLLKGGAIEGLQRLEAAVHWAYEVTRRTSLRSRVYLLLNTKKVVEDVQSTVQEVGHCLALVSLMELTAAFPDDLREKVAQLRTEMRSAVFEPSPARVDLANEIEEQLLNIDDQRRVIDIVTDIAREAAVPLSEAAELKAEVQRDLSEAQLEMREMDAMLLKQLYNLLSSVDSTRFVSQSSLGKKIQRTLSASIPASFKDPITGELMEDPVLLVEASRTYDRKSIERWFATHPGHHTCPDTGQELRSIEVVPNDALRQAIEEDVECINHKILGQGLGKLSSEDPKVVELAVNQLLNLSLADEKYADHLVYIGGVRYLAELLKGEAPLELKEKAIAIMVHLLALSDESKAEVTDLGIVPVLIKMCNESPVTVGARVLDVLAILARTEAGQAAIKNETGSVFLLAAVVNTNKDDRVKQVAEQALQGLWKEDPEVAIQMGWAGLFKPIVAKLAPESPMDIRTMMADATVTVGASAKSRVALVEEGVVPPLVDLLNNGTIEAKAAAVYALEHLSHTESNRVHLSKHRAIPALVQNRNAGPPGMREAAEATLANLALVDKDIESLDEEDRATMLILVLGNGTNREYAVRALEFMVKENGAKSGKMRSLLLGDDAAVPAIFDLLAECHSQSGSMRASTLILLSYLAQDPDASEKLVTSDSVTRIIVKLLDRPIPAEEREAVACILAGMAGNPSSRKVLLKEEALPALVKCLPSQSPNMRTHACQAISKFTNPSEPDACQEVFQLGAISPLIDVLRNGTDSARQSAAVALGNLSLAQPSLATDGVSDSRKHRGLGSKLMAGFGVKEKGFCKVHQGRCTAAGRFCLVESDAVPLLVALIKEGSAAAASSAATSLGTLLDDEEDSDRAVDYLVKSDIIDAVVGLIAKSPRSSKIVVAILERVFKAKKYRGHKFSDTAVNNLLSLANNGREEVRTAAISTLEQLKLLPKGSRQEPGS
eukprot:SM000018S03582  [mRNA]  locus=s18:164519:169405:- [translate_table: standard]